MKRHQKHILPEYFQAILDGEKTFELRLADWGCSPRDELELIERDQEGVETGRRLLRTIGSISKTKDAAFWKQKEIDKHGFQVLSLHSAPAEGTVIAITGPAGAGKTTTAGLLAKKLDRKTVNIDADTVKHYIVNSFKYDDSAEGNDQWRLLGNNIGQMARNYLAQDYTVIINGYINEEAWEEIKLLVRLSHRFLLLPSLDQTVSRDAGRAPETKMGKEAITVHHSYFNGSNYFKDFTVIDSSSQTAEQTVELLSEMI